MLRLFVNVYNDPDPARAAELAECLRRNRQNPLFDEVVTLGGRPTFREFFAAANRVVAPQDLTVIANSDIFFDDTLRHAHLLEDGECFALSRWDVAPSGGAELFDAEDSQDAWIFRGPIAAVPANFTMGVLGCDNRLARLLSDAGYRITNPSRTLHAYHVHARAHPRVRHGQMLVPGPYLYVAPTKLNVSAEKILHIALLAPGSPQWGLREALRALGSDYRELDWYSYQSTDRNRELRAHFARLLGEFSPTLVFAQLQTASVLGANDIMAARCPVVSWCGDLRNELPTWAIELAPHVISCFSNLRDVEALREKGQRAEYLQIGMSPGIFKPEGRLRPATPPIVFMGNNTSWFPLSGQRREMVAMLRQRYGGRFGVFGNHWTPAVPWLAEPEEAAAYRSCRIAINQNHYGDIGRFTSDRLLRAMGSGAFVVSNHYPGIELEFTPGKHLVTWRDFPELVQRIDYYLEHDEERRAIAAAGCAHVHTRHTWAARMSDLQDIVARHSNSWWRDLDRYAAKVDSQTGEDGIIRQIFACIGTTNRFLVDIGAGDGVTISNTYALRKQGWSGLLLDARDTNHESVVVARVTAENINTLLDAHGVPQEFDLLSMDIDGVDYWIWHAMRRRPRVLVMEFNGTIPEGELRTIPYDPDFRSDGNSDYYGASLAALESVGRAKGYTLVHQLHALNAFFVRTDLLPAHTRPVVRYGRHQYHARDPHERPWQWLVGSARAFCGDPFAAAEVTDLCRRYAIASIIEGGTYHGESTAFLSALADKVYTIEIDDAVWHEADHLDGIRNVTRIKGSSPVELRKLLPGLVGPTLYYADSHWGVPSPLPDELRAFAENRVRPVLVMRDFRNPHHPHMGFDTYGGQPYEWEWIKPYVEAIYGQRYRHYFNAIAGGACRGILYVVPEE